MSFNEVKAIGDYKSELFAGKEYLIIAKSSDIIEKKGYKLAFSDDIDMQLAVFRIDNILYALSNICPHRHADRIFEGIIDRKNIVCPLHGWTYSLESGMNIHQNRGTKNLTKYDIFESNGTVYLEKPELQIPKWREQISL